MDQKVKLLGRRSDGTSHYGDIPAARRSVIFVALRQGMDEVGQNDRFMRRRRMLGR